MPRMRRGCNILRGNTVLPYMGYHYRDNPRRRRRSILADSYSSAYCFRGNLGHRCMDWLDNGDNTPAETNRRNNNGNGREERRTKDGRAKTRGTSSRNDGRRKENGKEKKKLKKLSKAVAHTTTSSSS